MLDVVARLAGVHAQVMSSAELALWARVEGLEPDAVASALWEERTLVKTWAMRGTLHLLPAAELSLWITALRTRIERHFLNRARQKWFGFTRDEALELIAAIGEALDGRELTRAELAAAVGDERLLESWGSMLKPAAAAGELVFARGEGQKVRFTRPDWTPEEPAAALAEVTRRYLGAGGPATREDVARWWGATPAEGGRMLRRSATRSRRSTVEGAPMLLLREHVAEAAARRAAALGAAAAGLRPVRDRGDAARRGADAGPVQGARAPPAGLDLPRAAGRRAGWPGSGATSARASACSSAWSRSRPCRSGRARPPRPRRSASRASSAAPLELTWERRLARRSPRSLGRCPSFPRPSARASRSSARWVARSSPSTTATPTSAARTRRARSPPR